MPMPALRCCLLLTCIGMSGLAAAEGTTALPTSTMRRRPSAAVLLGDRLCVVNRQSGSVSFIDLDAGRVLSEQQLGERLSDVAVLDDESLLISDELAHELLLVRLLDEDFTIVHRVPVARYPVSIACAVDGSVAAAGGLWSRRVTLLAIGDAGPTSDASRIGREVSVTATVRLPFCPRRQMFIDAGRRLLVADGFGGQLAVIDSHSGAIESVRELPAQNIRGMSFSADGERVLLAHQILSPLARADFDDVHWGNLLQNVVREVPLAALLDPAADLVDSSRVTPLGEVGNGAADPAGIVVMPELDGRIVCLAGTGEVSVRTRNGGGRVAVGAQPTSAVWDRSRQMAYVLCTLDDAVAIVDPLKQTVVERISLGAPPEAMPADRGERLFVDGRRSHDGWISCQSCHPDGHTTGGVADTQSDGTYGTPKRILSLLGTRDNNPWAWNGQFRELHEQVASSFTSTLQGDHLPASDMADVVAYLHTLTPPPPVDQGEWTDAELAEIERGRQLFNGLGCRQCHVPPQTYTIDQTFDVGLEDEAHLTKFNPPSLRGLSQRQRYFHDGRAQPLEAVFTEYGHQLSDALSPDDLQALLAFLNSL